MGPVGLVQLGVSLSSQEKRVGFQLYHFHDSAVGGESGQGHTGIFQGAAVIIVNFVAVPVAFVNGLFSVEFKRLCGRIENTGIGAKAAGLPPMSSIPSCSGIR